MRARLPLLLVTAFFVTMNVLLWRSEFGDRHPFGASLPAEGVWQKVLTAPDNSFLSIRHHGKKVGTCHWSPSVGQDRAARLANEDAPPEGMVEEPTSYSIEVNGTVFADQLSRVRFSIDLSLSTNQNWQRLLVRVKLAPSIWELVANASDQSIRIRADDGQEHWEKSFGISDLQNPDKIVKELGGPLLPAILSSFGLSTAALAPATQSRASVGLHWEARYERIKVGGEWMRAIRLRARLLDRLQVLIFVSPVGEILRVELPDEIVLVNDALSTISNTEDDRIDSRR